MDDRGRIAQPLKRSHAARFGRILHRVSNSVEPYIPRGAGVASAAVLLAASLGYGTLQGGHVETALAQFRDARDALANKAGFAIVDVMLSGQSQLPREMILATGGITEHSSLLFLDAEDMRTRLKANPWIADASILKLYPNRLHVSVTERQPYALWQQDGHVSLIARDGAVLDSEIAPQFAGLPLMVGHGAGRAAADILVLMDNYPQLRDQVQAYVLVAERRWNLKLANGLDVRLPEEDPARALDTLLVLDHDKKLLSRDLVAIDLRLSDRVTVQLSDAAAQARADAQKDKKPRRKGGDA